ncbi:DUF2974 domain-containing protein [Treponema sp. OttesenSCG-928-L16]|nr:DUF2974 domain-containing protein [Treponema sp. OttesenSCG-928-L16]
MATIFDYLDWRGDLPFKQVPFNAVDNIIFCRLSYLPFDGIVPGPSEDAVMTIGEAAEHFADMMGRKKNMIESQIVMKDDPVFLDVLGKSPRFRDLGLTRYVNNIDISKEKQFSALTILIDDGSTFVSFRGTDNTIVGWKEDFNISFMDNVPSQLEAAAYLNDTGKCIWGPLKTGGHSKGGNLAIYASAFCKKSVQKRISAVYNNDAPGFNESVIESEGYKSIKDRIHTFVPQDSVIGMLFEHEGEYTVVKSVETGLLQHDVYSWEVGRDDVVRLNTVTKQSTFMDHTFKDWITGLSNEQREQFTEALYHILKATDAKTIPELTSSWLKNAKLMIQSLNTIDKPTKDLVYKSIAALIKAARNNIRILLPDTYTKQGSQSKQQRNSLSEKAK